MSHRRRDGEDSPSREGFNTPFRQLKKLGRPVIAPARPRIPEPLAEEPDACDDDEERFRRAVAGAVPIAPEDRNQVAAPPPLSPSPPWLSEDAEVLAELSDLVSGNGEFDVSDTDEHVEGTVVGLDPQIVQKLRGGEFSCQAHLDLHGMTSEEAKSALRQFILRALRAGHRCVLLVHGRGRNSPGQRPVLKEGLKNWLTRGELARVVLAFSTARACDGGAGATYLLLRRARRQKKPFRTLEGAKS